MQKKQTPLHLAASAGKQASCDMLITLGAGVDSTDDFGQKPVSYDFTKSFAMIIVRRRYGYKQPELQFSNV